MSTYVVLGARGGTGCEIVKQLLANSSDSGLTEVRAVVRDPAVVPEGHFGTDGQDILKVVKGNVADAETLRDIFKGANGVFFTAAGRDYEECQAVDMNGVGAVAELAKETNVGRVLLVSSMLVHPANRFHFVRGILNTIKGAMFHRRGLMDFKFEGEQQLRTSGQEYCVVRPGGLCDTQKGQEKNCGRAKLIVDQVNAYVGKGGNMTTRADVAAVSICAMTADETKNTTFELVSEAPLAVADKDVPPPSAELFQALKSSWDKQWPERLVNKHWVK